jgi:hypothetical protein
MRSDITMFMIVRGARPAPHQVAPGLTAFKVAPRKKSLRRHLANANASVAPPIEEAAALQCQAC